MGKLVKIPKRNGGFREIYVPHKTLKIELREILYNSLNYKQLQYCDRQIVNGFIPMKSIVTNAKIHVGYRFSYCMDISNAFDSVTKDMVREYLSEEELEKCFINERAYQGLPTSPALFNLATVKMVTEIKEFLSKYRNKIAFSMYADNISFSFNFYWDYELLRDNIIQIINKHGFEVNVKKSWLQDGIWGKRNICGIYVNHFGISVSRKFRRTLRAAIHNQRSEKVINGMIEHARLKEPINILPEKQIENLYNTYLLLFNKTKIKNHKNPDVSEKGRLTNALQRAQDYMNHPRKKRKEYVKEVIKSEIRSNMIKGVSGQKPFVVYKSIYNKKFLFESLSGAWIRKENDAVSPFEKALYKTTNLSRNPN